MTRFAISANERKRSAAYKRERYASDPEWRLAVRNKDRARTGRRLLTLDELPPVGEGRSKAARDEKGRFA